MKKTDFIDAFNNALMKNECFVFMCSCEINYSGRAEAVLAKGERIIIIKSDNTLLVHQPEGNTPVNYMKPGAAHELFIEGNNLILRSKNLKLKEYLDIVIHKTHNFVSKRLEDGQKLELAGNEKDMSDHIKNNPSVISKDFKPFSREEHTKYGFIDVFGHDKKGNVVIIECKRYAASLKDVSQLRRYVEKVAEDRGVPVKGIIAAPKITPNALKMLEDWGFSWKQINPPMRLRKYNKHQKSLGDYK